MSKTRNEVELLETWSHEAMEGLSVADVSDRDVQLTVAHVMENIAEEAGLSGKQILSEAWPGTPGTGETANSGFENGIGPNYGQGASDFAPMAFALARRALGDMFGHKVVGVQPMQGPVGLAYALRIRDTDGNEAWNNYQDTNYTGAQWDTTPKFTSSQGADTSTAEGWKLSDNSFTKMKPAIDSIAITAKTRKLAANFSTELAQDIKQVHSVDVNREMMALLHYQTQAELDREIVARMVAAGTANFTNIETVDFSSAAPGAGRWSQEQFAALVTSILSAANNIALKTRRGAGNFVIVSPQVATALQNSGPIFRGVDVAVNPTHVFSEIGTLNGTIKVYRDSYAPEDYFLVGFKGGDGISDAGIVWSPYTLGLELRATDPDNFSQNIGVMSRYALTDTIWGAGDYYEYRKVTGLGLGFTDSAGIIGPQA